jgi:ADP-ribose pyrophosphatase YjhB (NUDIX family)
MRGPVRAVHQLVGSIEPTDGLELQHRNQALAWLETTDDVFRRAKPATPDQHLVSYVVLVDPEDGSTLLVNHILAGLWLPAGGHVEPDEHPADAADREAREELGIEPLFAHPSRQPFFITITPTVGQAPSHTDVSLWFLLVGRRGLALTPEQREFTEVRWWSMEQVQAAGADRFDPHYHRFLVKLRDQALGERPR